MKLEELDYNLDKKLIAYYPTPERSASKLMIIYKHDKKIIHTIFSSIIDYLNEADTLVLNNTKTIKARLFATETKKNKNIEILLVGPYNMEEIEDIEKSKLWRALIKPKKNINLPTSLIIKEEIIADIIAKEGRFFILELKDLPFKIMEKYGQVPLPPYIKREPVAEDEIRYQTVYAKEAGSIAAPTAGFHFSSELLEKIAKIMNVTYITLHIGPGTFLPVREENVEEHTMFPEYYIIPSDTCNKINETIKRNGKVIAIGTSTVRALEDAASSDLNFDKYIKPTQKWATLFILPGHKFKIVNGIVTNFHLPRSTNLALVAAFLDIDFIKYAYKVAMENKYRFYTYGDAMLII